MIILGIDPGSRFLGFGVISVNGTERKPLQFGVLQFDGEMELTSRLLQIGEGVHDLLKDFKPDHVAIEKIFLGKNADSAFKLGHARGVTIYEALKNKSLVYEYATRVVKKGITGNGGAEKEHVRLVLQNLLKISNIKSLDASDALALAYYHSSQLSVLKLKATLDKNRKGINL